MEDFSYLLFTTKEEQSLINGWDVYEIQSSSADTIRTLDQLTHSFHQHHNSYGVGKLKYAGFYGIIPAVRSIVRFNMLNHPLLENLPSEFFSMFPYVITIVALVLFSGRSMAPKASGEIYDAGKR